MSYKPFKFTDNSVDSCQRFEQNVAAAFREQVTPSLPVQVVQFTASINSYSVKPSDVYLVVDSRGGPGKIVLPAPDRQTQAVAIKNAHPGGAVTIVQSDGKPMSGGASSFRLVASQSVRMVNTGKEWVSFGA